MYIMEKQAAFLQTLNTASLFKKRRTTFLENKWYKKP